MEGSLCFKIDCLIVRSKFTIFALFYFVFEGNFPSTSPRGAYIWRGDLTEGFLCYRFGGLYLEGLIFGILWVYYSYSYFMGSCYLYYLCSSLKNVLLLKFTPNFSYMQSYEVTPYLLNSVLMISSKLTCCSLCQYE